MRTFFDLVQQFGAVSADIIWFPLLVWTGVASIIFFVLRVKTSLNPLYHYHVRVATVLALPIGLISAVLIQLYSSLSASVDFSGSIFVVENPLPIVYSTVANTQTESSIQWFEANFIIGFVSSVLIFVASFLILRLIISFIQLRKLHKTLSGEPLSNTQLISGLKDGSVSVAFHSHPLVPFTFGWKNPIIVLPEKIKENSEKLDMAIKHELVHIRRGDYLLQLTLSVIESLFWFHPLIRIGANEIETYREISCDQEVLNTSDIQPKKYANLLLELIPLKKDYANFTVSMAVKQSTLKQRIETMKHHKMHQTSFKRSLLILLSITLMVIAPIACSDLRGPDTLSDEEILNEQISIEDFKVEINSKVVLDLSDQKMKVTTNGTGAIGINPHNYGLFKIGIYAFEGSTPAGAIDGNRITFKVNEMNVSILSSNNILLNNEHADIWVQHDPNYQSSSVAIAMGNPDTPMPPSIQEIPLKLDEEVFVVVESMPQLEGGQKGIQSKVTYPKKAIEAGIEGRVTVQFVVDENGDVVNPKVIRGIGGGCDEEALRVISQAKFTPGVQRGRNVAVQMSMPILFKLSNSEFQQSSDFETPPPPPIKIETLESSNGIVKVKLSNNFGPLVGASVNIEGTNKGAVTDQEGIATIKGLDKGTYKFVFSYVGHGQPEKEIIVN